MKEKIKGRFLFALRLVTFCNKKECKKFALEKLILCHFCSTSVCE